MSEKVPFVVTSTSTMRYVTHQLDSPYPNHTYRIYNYGPDTVTVSRQGAGTGDAVDIVSGATVDVFMKGDKNITITLKSGGSFAAGAFERFEVPAW